MIRSAVQLEKMMDVVYAVAAVLLMAHVTVMVMLKTVLVNATGQLK